MKAYVFLYCIAGIVCFASLVALGDKKCRMKKDQSPEYEKKEYLLDACSPYCDEAFQSHYYQPSNCYGSKQGTLNASWTFNKEQFSAYDLDDGLFRVCLVCGVVVHCLLMIFMALQMFLLRRKHSSFNWCPVQETLTRSDRRFQNTKKHNLDCNDVKLVENAENQKTRNRRNNINLVENAESQKTTKRRIRNTSLKRSDQLDEGIDFPSNKDATAIKCSQLEHLTSVKEKEVQTSIHLPATEIEEYQFSGNRQNNRSLKKRCNLSQQNETDSDSEVISIREGKMHECERTLIEIRPGFFDGELFETVHTSIDVDETTERKVINEEWPRLELSSNSDSNHSVFHLKLPNPVIHISEETVLKGRTIFEDESKISNRDFSTGYPLNTASTNYELSSQKLNTCMALKSECTLDSVGGLNAERLVQEKLKSKHLNLRETEDPCQVSYGKSVTSTEENLKVDTKLSKSDLILEIDASDITASKDNVQKDTHSLEVSSSVMEEAPAEKTSNTRSLDTNYSPSKDCPAEQLGDFDSEKPDCRTSSDDSDGCTNNSRESASVHEKKHAPKDENTDPFQNGSDVITDTEKEPLNNKDNERSDDCDKSETKKEFLKCEDDTEENVSKSTVSHVGDTVPLICENCIEICNKPIPPASTTLSNTQIKSIVTQDEDFLELGRNSTNIGKKIKKTRIFRRHRSILSQDMKSTKSLEQKQEYAIDCNKLADSISSLDETMPVTSMNFKENSETSFSVKESGASYSCPHGKIKYSSLVCCFRCSRGNTFRQMRSRNKGNNTFVYTKAKKYQKKVERTMGRNISELHTENSLDMTSDSKYCSGRSGKKFCRVCHRKILKTDTNCRQHVDMLYGNIEGGSLNQSSLCSECIKRKLTCKTKKEYGSPSSKALAHKDSGFISGQSYKTDSVKDTKLKMYCGQSCATLLHKCIMKEISLEKPSSDFYQQLKVLNSFLHDEERRSIAKEISRELYIERGSFTVFGLGQYFDRLSNGPPPTTRERMQYEWLRLASFSSYTGNGNALALARNGFYHDQTEGSTFTRCFLCEASSSTWEMFDNVSTEHRTQSPNCPFHGNIEEESINISINSVDSSDPSTQNRSSTQNTAARSVNSASSFSSSSLGPSVSAANSTGLASVKISEAGRDIGRKLEGTHISQARIHNSGAESISQQPTEDPECRDRPSLALSQTSTQRTPGLKGHPYSTIIAPRQNNVAGGARSNVGIETSGSSSGTSGTPSQQPGTRNSGIWSHPVGQGAFFAAQTPDSNVTEALQGSNTLSANTTPKSGTGQATPGSGAGGADPTATVVVENPKHPDYSNIETRVSSYRGWPDYLDQTPRQMAEAGFFFVGVADFSRCFCCGGGLRNWEPGDDPMLEHTRWFPRCDYVRKLKGERYVAAVQRRHQEHMAEQQRQQIQLAERRDANRNPPDPMTTDAAAVMREMGYSSERTLEAILAVRQQTGSSLVTTQQVLTWLLDDEERRTSRNTAFGVRSPATSSTPTSIVNTSIPSSIVYTGTSIASSIVYTGTSIASSIVYTGTSIPSSIVYTGTSIPSSIMNTGTSIGASIVDTTSSISTATSIVSAGTTTSTVSSTSTSATAQVQQTGTSVPKISTLRAENGQTEGNQTGAVSTSSSSSGVSVEKQSGDSDESRSTGTGDTTGNEQSGKATKKKNAKKKAKSKAGSRPETGATGGGLDPKSLKAENEKLREMQTCKICMERPVNTTLLPCGHLVCCESCASRLQRCPICRKRIKGTVKTFMS